MEKNIEQLRHDVQIADARLDTCGTMLEKMLNAYEAMKAEHERLLNESLAAKDALLTALRESGGM